MISRLHSFGGRGGRGGRDLFTLWTKWVPQTKVREIPCYLTLKEVVQETELASRPPTNAIYSSESPPWFSCVCERERHNIGDSKPIPEFSDTAMMHVQYLDILKRTYISYRTSYIQTPHISVICSNFNTSILSTMTLSIEKRYQLFVRTEFLW